MKLLSGNSNRPLSEAIAKYLGVDLCRAEVKRCKDGEIFVIEVNPRASRTVPFVSKCIGVSLAKVAARCMVGITLEQQKFTREIIPTYFNVKEAVFPFNKFPSVDPILGPEMKSTGEVMGCGETFGEAFAKSQWGAGERLPKSGRVVASTSFSGARGSGIACHSPLTSTPKNSSSLEWQRPWAS